jgi:hypothetical protein
MSSPSIENGFLVVDPPRPEDQRADREVVLLLHGREGAKTSGDSLNGGATTGTTRTPRPTGTTKTTSARRICCTASSPTCHPI